MYGILAHWAKDWRDNYETYGSGKFSFKWKPPVKRTPKPKANVAKVTTAASSGSSGSSTVAASDPSHAWNKNRIDGVKKHVLQLKLTAKNAPKCDVEVCVFDNYTFLNLHRILIKVRREINF